MVDRIACPRLIFNYKLAAESPVYDALYEWCRRQIAA